MSKSVVITEKPSVARDIVAVLGGFTEHDGWFESDDYLVTFAVGHLFELLAPEEVDEKYKAWRKRQSKHGVGRKEHPPIVRTRQNER